MYRIVTRINSGLITYIMGGLPYNKICVGITGLFKYVLHIGLNKHTVYVFPLKKPIKKYL